MEWKIVDINDEFLLEVNCQYDALDLAVMMYGANKVEINFSKQEAKIIE